MFNHMKKISLVLLLILMCAFGAVPALAKTATRSAQASDSGMPAAVETVTPAPEKTQKEDITVVREEKGRLTKLIEERSVGDFGPFNFLQVLIKQAVERGVPANTIVLMLMFPLVAAFIAAARHIIGLQGFGIFTPAVVSVAFLATGVTVGVLLFVLILVMATIARIILKKLRLPTMPRMALLLWFVSLGILAMMLISPYFKISSLITLNIFPILLLILLAETFIEVQITRNFKSALELTAETLFLALISFLILSMQWLQEWVLVRPELTVVLIAALDILIGRYKGLRLMERMRFRELLSD
jgi:hypothetical protein